MSSAQKSVNEQTVSTFKSDVITACPSLVTLKDQYVARSLPNSVFETIFREVFEGDNALARDVLFGRVERLRNSEADKAVESISTISRAATTLASAAERNLPVLLISDNDNDGALSQAIAMEGRRLMQLNMSVQGKDYNPTNHGFSVDQIDDWAKSAGLGRDDEFVVMVVDLGTNQRDEQNLFLASYPKATLVIADHHKPDLDQMVNVDAGRSILVSPYVKGSVELSLRGGGGVSGGYLLYTLMKNAARVLHDKGLLNGFVEDALLPMQELGRAANLLDMVKCDIRLKPLHESDIEKALDLASLTNNGRSVSRWISAEQVEHLNALKPFIGEENVNKFIQIRSDFLEKNHIAKALINAVPSVFETSQLKNQQIAIVGEIRNLIGQSNVIEILQVPADLLEDNKTVKSIVETLNKLSSVTNDETEDLNLLNERKLPNIEALKKLVGEDGLQHALYIPDSAVEQNPAVKALIHSVDNSISLSIQFEKMMSLYENAMLMISKEPVEDSYEKNYIEEIRPYLFNFSYEQRHEGGNKKQWLDMASSCLKDIGGLDQKIRVLLRENNLVKQISNDFVIVTQASNAAVERAFSSKQLDKAYQSLDKTIKLSVVATHGNRVVLSSRSDISMHEVLSMAADEFPSADLIYRGHGGAGALTVIASAARDDRNFEPLLGELTAFLAKKAKLIVEAKDVTNAIYVEPIHLPLIQEIFQKTRSHLTPGVLPDFLLRVNEDTTFEDSYTLEKRPVHDIVNDNEWITTVEPLSFDGGKKLLLPNQALKTLAKDNFTGALSLRLLTNGAFMASKVYTGVQLKNKNIPKMTLPVEREREQLAQFYRKHFKDRDYPAIGVSREEAIQAIQFAADPEKVFLDFEATVTGLLAKTQSDSYVVLDVEADGAGDAQCINVGLAIYRKAAGSGETMTTEQFGQLIEQKSAAVDNYRYIDENTVIINERITIEIASQLASTDAGIPIQVSLKVQNLTNITMDMLAELGASSDQVQRNIMNVLKDKGKMIFQAHNLPYDNNISRVNYPELYQLMSESLHLDSAVPAKKQQIAYTGIKVNELNGVEFYNAEHPGYNLSTLLSDLSKDNFVYPSIKGTHILKVTGQDVVLFDKGSRVSTKLALSRNELADTLLPALKPMQYPKYGIEKLLRMATIRDMIDHQPVKETVFIPYESVGGATMPPDLWKHFQTHYAFEKTPDENILAFKMLPEVMEVLDGTFITRETEAPRALVIARSAGNDNFSINKKFKTKDAEAEHKKSINTFSFEDVLKMNVLDFLTKNESNAERYARSWLYELVLEQHETTEKTPQVSFIAGISELTGVQPDMIKTIYDEVYRYKKFRNIQSYRVHETHNNIGLEGDAFQESVAFIHMLKLKRSNPYLVGDVALRNGMNGNTRVIDDLFQQVAASSLKQIIRQTTRVAMDSDRFNTYSSKQMEQFNDAGISAKQNRGSIPTMRCKTLSESDKTTLIELPEFNANTFRNLHKDERQALEERMEMAVTLLILSNSRNALPTALKTKVEELVASKENLKFLSDLRKEFGKAFATEKEYQIKNILSSCCNAILGIDVLKLPSNREIPPEDLDMCEDALKTAIDRLASNQGFESCISKEAVSEALYIAKGQYLANQQAFKDRAPVTSYGSYLPLDQYAKGAQTSRLKLLANVLSEHETAFPELATTALGKKKDPVRFLMESPLLGQLMKHTTANNMTLERVKGLKYS